VIVGIESSIVIVEGSLRTANEPKLIRPQIAAPGFPKDTMFGGPTRCRLFEVVLNCDHAVPDTKRGFAEALFVVPLVKDCETV